MGINALISWLIYGYSMVNIYIYGWYMVNIMEVSSSENGGTPLSLDGFCSGKSHGYMDDLRVALFEETPISNPLNSC